MGSRSLLFVIGILFACCLLLVCCGGMAALGYLFFSSPGVVTQASTTPAPATEIPTVPATPTVQAACPGAVQDVLRAGQGESTGAGIGLSGDSSSGTDDPDSTTLVTFDVRGDVLGAPIYESVSPELQAVQNTIEMQRSAWELFRALIPAEQRSMVTEFLVFTDGPGNILAAVQQSGEDAKLWVVEVDSADLSDRAALTFTLVHEFGHLLTLSSSQVPPDAEIFRDPEDEGLYTRKLSACPTFFPGEGCSLSNSYINAFYDRFWPDIVDEWQAIDDLSYGDDMDRYYDELYAFYQSHHDEFVDDYAATDPTEDIAESFAFFVFSPKPAGSSVSDEKLRFFYEYPELVELRSEILTNLCEVHP